MQYARITCSALAVVAMVLVSPSHAAMPEQNPPFYSAFKTFCIDTGADYLEVQAAVERAGGKRYVSPEFSTILGLRNSAMPPRTTVWQIVWHSQSLEVQASTIWPRLKPIAPSPDEAVRNNCTVRSSTSEEASARAIAKWVGVPQQPRSLQYRKLYPRNRSFEFQLIGSTRMAVANDAQRRQAIVEGRHWKLFVYATAASTDVSLVHELPESSALLAAARADQPVIASPTDISKDAAIQTGRKACGGDWGDLDDKFWRARREGSEWRVWTSSPPDGDPDDDATYVAFQVWIEAKSGKVRTCMIRTE